MNRCPGPLRELRERPRTGCPQPSRRGASAASPTCPNNSREPRLGPGPALRAAPRRQVAAPRAAGVDERRPPRRCPLPVARRDDGHLGGRLAARRARARPARRRRRGAAGAPRSPLVTSTRSGISITPGLHELERVAGARLHAEDHEVGDSRRSRSRTGRRPRSRRSPSRSRRASAPPPERSSSARPPSRLPRGHRADEDPGILGVGLDPGAVAEQRPARAARRRIDGDHRDGLAPVREGRRPRR